MANENRTTLRLPSDLKAKLQEEAAKQHRSVHNLILAILLEYFEKKS